MGRRSKNKQAAPEPLHAKVFPSPKKLGKRKADHEADADLKKTHPRPTKKLRDSRKPNTQSSRKENATIALKNSDHAVSSGSSSDGWEDVEDDHLASHTK
jgi:25S rRNA (cytosine2870-C5)-methyltransferase